MVVAVRWAKCRELQILLSRASNYSLLRGVCLQLRQLPHGRLQPTKRHQCQVNLFVVVFLVSHLCSSQVFSAYPQERLSRFNFYLFAVFGLCRWWTNEWVYFAHLRLRR